MAKHTDLTAIAAKLLDAAGRAGTLSDACHYVIWQDLERAGLLGRTIQGELARRDAAGYLSCALSVLDDAERITTNLRHRAMQAWEATMSTYTDRATGAG